MTKVKEKIIANKIRKILKEDILWRYDNSEYWDFDLDAIGELLSLERKNITEKEKKEILNLVR